MPTYQYACTECGSRLEAVQAFSDDALTECPACAGRLRKVFSAVGVVFKGSGFYRTDSRGTPKGESTADSGTKTDAKGGSTSDGKGGSAGNAPAPAAASSSSSSSSSASKGSGASSAA